MAQYANLLGGCDGFRFRSGCVNSRNKTCQFDIAYCFVVEAEGTGRGGAYPSSAALSEDRAKPIALKIVADQDVRHRLFPNSDDAGLARAVLEVYKYAIREPANNYGARWWDVPPTVQQFIDRN